MPEVCGDAVYYIDPYNAADFKAAIRRMDNDPLLREELTQKGLAQAQKFSWQKAADEYLQVLNTLRVGR